MKSVKSVDFIFLSTNDTNCTKFFFLSPDEPDEPEGWRKCNVWFIWFHLVIKFKKKGRLYHNGYPQTIQNEKRILLFSTIAFPCLFSMLCVILVVTPLAQCFQVIIRAVFWRMVEVGNRQHNICVLTSLWVVAISVIFHPTELAAVICSFQNPFSYLLPILWIARFVFWFNGHYPPPSSLPPSYHALRP